MTRDGPLVHFPCLHEDILGPHRSVLRLAVLVAEGRIPEEDKGRPATQDARAPPRPRWFLCPQPKSERSMARKEARNGRPEQATGGVRPGVGRRGAARRRRV